MLNQKVPGSCSDGVVTRGKLLKWQLDWQRIKRSLLQWQIQVVEGSFGDDTPRTCRAKENDNAFDEMRKDVALV